METLSFFHRLMGEGAQSAGEVMRPLTACGRNSAEPAFAGFALRQSPDKVSACGGVFITI